MALLNTFDSKTTELVLSRLNNLSNASQPQWGKMNVAQMLAHLNVAYDLAYGKTTPKTTNFMIKIILKLFVKNVVVGENPYKRSLQTSPEFIISNERDFEKEKSLLISNIKETETKGITYFEGKESASFGVLTSKQWSNLFYKHIDHHFTQFGV
jgi:hypothetical protein